MNDLQNCILEIYKKVSAICDAHDIRYFAIGGTAIGCARHAGFIPWDDDLDIAVPIEDFEKLLVLLDSDLIGDHEVVTAEGRIHYTHVFAKVEDVKTTVIESLWASFPDRYTGVWVDIMPMSGVPSDFLGQKTFCTKVRFMRSLNSRLKLPYESCRSFKSKILWLASCLFESRLEKNYFLNKWFAYLKKHPFDKADYTGYTWSDPRRLIFPKEWFSDYILMPFEDTQMRMPIGYDAYLTQQFGDYMTVPPEDQRITHNGFVDLEHSYRDYQSGKLQIPEGYFDGK